MKNLYFYLLIIFLGVSCGRVEKKNCGPHSPWHPSNWFNSNNDSDDEEKITKNRNKEEDYNNENELNKCIQFIGDNEGISGERINGLQPFDYHIRELDNESLKKFVEYIIENTMQKKQNGDNFFILNLEEERLVSNALKRKIWIADFYEKKINILNYDLKKVLGDKYVLNNLCEVHQKLYKSQNLNIPLKFMDSSEIYNDISNELKSKKNESIIYIYDKKWSDEELHYSCAYINLENKIIYELDPLGYKKEKFKVMNYLEKNKFIFEKLITDYSFKIIKSGITQQHASGCTTYAFHNAHFVAQNEEMVKKFLQSQKINDEKKYIYKFPEGLEETMSSSTQQLALINNSEKLKDKYNAILKNSNFKSDEKNIDIGDINNILKNVPGALNMSYPKENKQYRTYSNFEDLKQLYFLYNDRVLKKSWIETSESLPVPCQWKSLSAIS